VAGKVKLEEFKAMQEDEWYTFVAREVILIGEARAFNIGDAVPVSHVTRGVVNMSQVIRREDITPDMDIVAPVRISTPPPGASDVASPEDVAAAEAANRAAGVIE